MRHGKVFILVAFVLAGILAGSTCHAQSAELPKKIPVTVAADNLEYDRTNDVYLAVGHVKIEQEGVRLEADKVVLNNRTGEATAEGSVQLQDQGSVVKADKLKININTREGIITKGDIFMKKDNFHLKGDLIEQRSETVYHVEQGRITTCDEDEWYLNADELNIDMNRYATGRGVTFNMMHLPVFYTPYFLFPVRRQSGFLIPELGHSSRDGFFVGNSFFWAISDYKDMTIYSDYRERIGHGTGVEYRYENSRDSSGQMYYKYFDMYHTGGARWNFRFEHKEDFADDISARADINLVSDPHYFYDLDKKLEERSKSYLDSNVYVVERWNTASLTLLGQYSVDLTQPNENTVQKLPELRYTVFDEPIVGPLHVGFEGSATNFTKQGAEVVRRVDFNPRLSATFGSKGLSFTPRAGYRATFYDRSATTAEAVERKYFFAGADINARISRVYGTDAESGIGRIRHSIEPTLSYTYIPHISQGNLPLLDSVDTVSVQNFTGISLINRLTAHYKESKEAANFSTFDLMVMRLSQSYDLNAARVQGTPTRPRSPVLGELYVKTPKMLTLSASGSYDTYARVMTSHSEGATLKADTVSVNLSQQYLREPQTRFLIGGTSFKLGKWDLGAQWWRDVQNRKTTQEEYKLHYSSQCWGIGLSYTVKPGETQFMAMLDLKGIGGK